MSFALPSDTPKFLYRYRPVDSYSLRTISHSEFFFCSLDSLNDPFDCNLDFEYADTSNEIADYIADMAARTWPTVPAEELRRVAYNQVLSGDARKTMNSVIAAIRSEFQEKLCMLCMSNKNDDILMYSHYANGHKGLCLEFATTTHKFYDRPFKVEYSETFPQPKFSKFDSKNLESLTPFLCTKAMHWSYEQEWRIIKPEKAGLRQFPPKFLTGIILGSQIEPSSRNSVIEAIQQRGVATKLYEARKSSGRFSLEIRELGLVK
ncbi:MAG: DUF2971 domain-containing protein [Bacteroidota bacterium]